MSASAIHCLSFFLRLLLLMSWSFMVVFIITFLYRGPVSPYRTLKFKGHMKECLVLSFPQCGSGLEDKTTPQDLLGNE